ncbi:hypothetical protein VSAK1_26295 [Vibrio mediterranei AK1]|uniref:hypothetical protein n=1 Tax=Vibrio mediterranei TaxID=689 RepID=UPI0001541216|nr:hypothetical protein [Vibrio mediterranei]EDL53753.1 hypothetical protein VSAK1_26295 [Vibrio mediterranei AK1]
MSQCVLEAARRRHSEELKQRKDVADGYSWKTFNVHRHRMVETRDRWKHSFTVGASCVVNFFTDSEMERLTHKQIRANVKRSSFDRHGHYVAKDVQVI